MSFNYWQDFDENDVYHIYNRSIQELLLFQDESDYLFFLRKYKQYLSPYFLTYAYCLIPNHFHLLIKVKPFDDYKPFLKAEKTIASSKLIKEEISLNDFLVDQMKRFFSSFALRNNKKYKRRGRLFMEKFKRVEVGNDSKLSHLVCYIHHNPIHHGLTKSMLDWKYSSFRAYNSKQKTLIEKEIVLAWFGGLRHFLDSHKMFQLDFSDEKKIKKKLGLDS